MNTFRSATLPAASIDFAESRLNSLLIGVGHFLLFLIYFHALSKMYMEYIQPLFEYMGLRAEVNSSRIPLSFAMLLVCSMVMPTRFGRVSDFMCGLVMLVTLVPTAVLYVYGGLTDTTFYCTVFATICLLCTRFLPTLRVSATEVSVATFLTVTTALGALGISIVIFIVGASGFSLDFIEVYSRREIVQDNISGLPAYLTAIGVQANLFAMVAALFFKKYRSLAINLLVAFLYFGIMGHKTQIVLPFLMIILRVIIDKKWAQTAVISFVVVTSILCSYFMLWTDSGLLFISLTFRRVMFMPIVLNQAYVDYYNTYGYLFWSYSKIGFGVLDYGDSFDPSVAIGYYLLNSDLAHANTGMIGSGYMNAGFAGVAIYAVILTSIASLVDSLAIQKNAKPVATLLCVPMILAAVTSGDLPAMFLSGGLGSSVLALLFLPSGNKVGAAAAAVGNAE